MPGRFTPFATLLVLTSVLALPARADQPSCAPGDAECGHAAFARGTASFDRGDYAEATGFFRAAASADPHPIVVFNLALSEVRSGKLLDGTARFRALLGEGRAEPALKERAERELGQAEARLAKVSFALPEPGKARIFLNGAPVVVSSGELVVDPGMHRIRVESGNDVAFDQDVELSPGERLHVRVTSRTRSIDVVLLPGRPAASPDSKVREVVPPVPEPSPRGLAPGWFIAAAAGTAVFAGASIWSGVDVQRAYDDYRRDLPRLDQAQADERVAAGHSRERRTNWLIAATTVSAAGTAVLGLGFTRWSTPRRAATSVGVSPLGITASGEF